jgi:hypothetical protein
MRIVGWPSERSTARSVMPGTVAITRRSVGGLLQRLQVVAVDLDRILALDAGGGLLDVVLDVLREIEIDAGKLR